MIPEAVLTRWDLPSTVEELGFGKINDTYKVGDNIIVQRINPKVFVNPIDVVANYRQVFPYICDLVPDIVQTKDGQDSVVDADGSVWRVFPYYGSRSFRQLPDSLCQIAGESYGQFLKRLKDCHVELRPSIPGFHRLDSYIEKLNEQRRSGVQLGECVYVDEVLDGIQDVSVSAQVIHGDCKIGNLLFDPLRPRVLKIVDLDTVMYGSPSWDFGDLVRSSISGMKFDSDDDARLRARVHELCRGFFGAYGPRDQSAVTRFASAPAYMSFMLGVRYLTDHLAGDVYFKVDRPGANLLRARQQFSLHRLFTRLHDELAEFIVSI